MVSLRTAFRFLYSLRAQPAPPAGAQASWLHWVVPLGLLSGAGLAAIVGLSWGHLTYRPGGLWMVIVPAMLAYWLGPAAVRFAGWGRTMASIRLGARLNDLPHDCYPGLECLGLMVLSVTAVAICQFVAIAMLPTVHAATVWLLPVNLQFVHQAVFPQTHYGAIVLMAGWGNAAVLLASCLGRPAGHAEPIVRQLLAVRAWPKLLWGTLAPATVSTVFIAGWRRRWGDPWPLTLSRAGFDALAIAVIMFGVTMLFAWLLARRVQGHCRATLLAAGLLGEVAFLVIFHTMYK